MPNTRTDWSRIRAIEVAHERNYKYEGLTVAEIAKMENKHPLDAFFDLALDEDLQTEFYIPVNRPDEEMAPLLSDPYCHISMSDGGAHTRFFVASIWPVHFLARWVRDKELMSLEQAHYKMSALPAWFTDFTDRGVLRVGKAADIIIYNLEELGYVHDRPIYATDFPGGERRLVQKPTGLRYTIVNGVVTFEGNDCTGALPGNLLRSYDMVG
jgi:N-acyl-D-aspartate/D-glutamate deacylase